MNYDLNKKNVWISIFLLISLAVFVFFEFIAGHLLWPAMNNSSCLNYLGCNAGFFGYDALVHFTAGIMETAFILWLINKYPNLNSFQYKFARNLFMFSCLIIFIGVFWEFFEFALDHIRMDLLHLDLLHPINRLYQASNDDTMGDLFFGWLASILAILSIKIFKRDVL